MTDRVHIVFVREKIHKVFAKETDAQEERRKLLRNTGDLAVQPQQIVIRTEVVH